MAKTIFITGSSSGIGRASALYFAEKGWQVVSTMRNPEQRNLPAHQNITYMHLDVTDPQSVRTAVTEANRRFTRIDVLLNNAGYAVNGVFESITGQQLSRQFATNVFGLMNLTREFLPHFRQQQGGTIINVASVGGRIGFPLYCLYQGTKFAVEGFSESLAIELRHLNIKVRLIEPGVILTDFYTRSMDFGAGSGIADYAGLEKKVARKNGQLSRQGSKPEAVARRIYQAAVSRSWQLRYPVGMDARALFFLRWLLPFSWFSALIRRILVG